MKPLATLIIIEKASIDEIFIDFSKRIRDLLIERYPFLEAQPESGPDTPLPPPPATPWPGIGHVIPAAPAIEATPAQDQTQAESMTTWHDVALSLAAEVMDEARRKVLQELGYSTSAVSLIP